MEIENFTAIEPEFQRLIAKIVWCTFTTIDRQGRPRSRMLHPIWDGSTGWVATGRHSFKTKHLAEHSYVSLSYWDPGHEQVFAECHAQWDDSLESKQRIWSLYKQTPAPLGYDLTVFWSDFTDENYGLIKLTPWRIELSSLADMMNPQVWRQQA